MEAKVLTWNKFREICKEDAYKWHNAGWFANEITEYDIIHEYPDNYFSDNIETEHDELSSAFIPSDFAKQTLEYLEEIESEETKMMLLQNYFDSHLKFEKVTLLLKGNWKTDERIDIIKKVNHIESNYMLTVEYIEDKDETVALYMREY